MPRTSSSGDILPGMLREHLVDQRLVADPSAPRLFAEARQDVRVHANRDQLTRRSAEGRAAHPPHRPELFIRRLRNVREINPPTWRGTPSFLSGSRASR